MTRSARLCVGCRLTVQRVWSIMRLNIDDAAGSTNGLTEQKLIQLLLLRNAWQHRVTVKA